MLLLFLHAYLALTLFRSAAPGQRAVNDVEIMMVLDKSRSMVWTDPGDTYSRLENLKTAAKSFVEFFRETQSTDKMGLITFGTGAAVKVGLGIDFVDRMITEIDAMTADTGQGTNAEYALEKAAGSLTDPGERRVKQFLIFFTDGNPDAFKGTFTINGITFDAVAYATSLEDGTGACDGGIGTLLCDPTTGGASVRVLPATGDLALPTGDGKLESTTKCTGLLDPVTKTNTKWWAFGTTLPTGVSDPEQCAIPRASLLGDNWFKPFVRNMAINHAQEIKDQHIKIYVIGLGNYVDANFFRTIASGDEFYYPAPTSDQLKAIFNRVAKEIRLQLVQ